jgi:hypothetical protein
VTMIPSFAAPDIRREFQSTAGCPRAIDGPAYHSGPNYGNGAL